MVEIKSMKLDHHHFIGVQMHLPRYPVHFIMSTRVFLVQEIFSMDYFKQHEKPVAVLQVAQCDNFESLLAAQIIELNEEAYQRGARKGMLAKDALLCCED